MEEVLEIVNSVVNKDVSNSTSLVGDKILNSLNIIKLVALLNEHFGIRISPMHLLPSNFNSVEAIYNLVSSLM